MKIRVTVEYEEADKALPMFLPTSVIFQLNHLIIKKKSGQKTPDLYCSPATLGFAQFPQTENVTCIFRFL